MLRLKQLGSEMVNPYFLIRKSSKRPDIQKEFAKNKLSEIVQKKDVINYEVEGFRYCPSVPTASNAKSSDVPEKITYKLTNTNGEVYPINTPTQPLVNGLVVNVEKDGPIIKSLTFWKMPYIQPTTIPAFTFSSYGARGGVGEASSPTASEGPPHVFAGLFPEQEREEYKTLGVLVPKKAKARIWPILNKNDIVCSGPGDLTNTTLPQLPIPEKLLPNNRLYGNPARFMLNDCKFLVVGEQGILDIKKQCPELKTHLDVMKCLLMWGHLFPTCPDTLPGVESEEFIVGEMPHVFLAAGKNIEGPEVWNGCLLIAGGMLPPCTPLAV